MADNKEQSSGDEHGPSNPHEINPKLASNIRHWSREFGVTGDTLHEAIRVHGTHVEKVKAALAGTHSNAQHEKHGR